MASLVDDFHCSSWTKPPARGRNLILIAVTSAKSHDAQCLFENCELALRSKVGDLAVENGPDIMKRIAEFSATIRTTRGENLRIMVGLQSIRVIAEQKALEKFRQTLRTKDLISYSTDLTEISLLLLPEAIWTKEIIAKTTTELALNDVNLVGRRVLYARRDPYS